MKKKFVTQYSRSCTSIKKPTFSCISEDKTVKSLAKDCEISKIYERLCNGENVSRVNVCYDENLINHQSLIDAHNSLVNAKDYFEHLPAEVKAQYKNDLFEFAKAFTNRDESIYNNGILKKITPFTQNTEKVVASEEKNITSGAIESTSDS